MTVGELIKRLESFDPNMPAVIEGNYEIDDTYGIDTVISKEFDVKRLELLTGKSYPVDNNGKVVAVVVG